MKLAYMTAIATGQQKVFFTHMEGSNLSRSWIWLRVMFEMRRFRGGKNRISISLLTFSLLYST